MLNVLLLIFSIVVNGYIMSWILYVIFLLYCLFAPHVDYAAYNDTLFYFMGYTTCVILNAIAINKKSSELVSKIIASIYKIRAASQTECMQIDPIIDSVLSELKQKHLWNLQLIVPIKILIIDTVGEFSCCIGVNTIILSFGTLSNTQALRAIITQEISRLHFKSGVMILGIVLTSIPLVMIMFLCSLYMKCLNFITKSLGQISKLLYFIAFIPLILCSPVIVLNFIGKHLISLLTEHVSKKYDYKADQIVVSMGLKNALHAYLSNNPQYEMPGILGNLLFNHRASSMSRISRL